MGQPFVQIDAFTDTPFGGNPAAVYLLETAADEAWMQAVAREMNLSETAFLERRSDGWDLRWFTPTYEVDLCGHATLASAHYLWESGNLGGDEIARFHTRSGLLTAVRDGDWIVLDFPALDAAPANSISYRDFSPRAPGSTKTRSRGRPTACSRPIGRRNSARPGCSRFRPRAAAVWCGSNPRAGACTLGARR